MKYILIVLLLFLAVPASAEWKDYGLTLVSINSSSMDDAVLC